MSYDFNADEIFEMAMQIERNGALFYRQAAEGTSEPGTRELLLRLAEMEVDHEQRFEALRAGLTEKERTGVTFDPQNEAVAYLKALADTRVFFEKALDRSSLREVLKAAISAEKDSILFYLGMKDAVPESLGKGRLEGIIQEEMGHIRLLSRELLLAQA